MYRRWLHYYCIAVALATLFLIVAGAAVVSHEAGLSVPDWPLSYGKVMPDMRGGVFYEHGHRLVATTVGFLTVVLATLLAIYEDRPWIKRLGFLAVGLVIAQGLLGGLTVLLKLPPQVSMAHAALAQAFFTLTVAIALFTSRSFRDPVIPMPDAGWPSLRTLAAVTPVAVFCQLILGAAFRHKAAGLIPHILGAMIVLTLAMMAGLIVILQYRNAQLRLWGWLVLVITSLQVFLGIGAYITRLMAADSLTPQGPMVFATVAHVATGAIVLASASMLAIQTRRHLTKAVPAPAHQQETVSAIS